ncbi:MAG: hypothetical protein K6G06_09330 [Butyrivibrio sp.]|nr:hypothetical protein [Butyrivibrio sp.]
MYEIGSEFNFEKINDRTDFIELLSHEAEKKNRYIEFLRCGRDAIGFVADDIIARSKTFDDDADRASKVFIPALSCDSMVKPFEVRGFEVVFYRLNEDLSVDKDYLEELIAFEKRPVVLVMNLFGITDTGALSQSLKAKNENTILIEDVTHIITEPENFLGGEGESLSDYHVGSIRKWLGVPDGAVAISKSEFVMGALTGETDFSVLRAQAMEEKTRYLDNGDQNLKTHFRALLSEAEDSLNDGLDPYIMSDLSADYLSEMDLDNLQHRRRVNYDTLYKALKELPLCGKAFKLYDKVDTDAQTPFMLQIVLDIDFMQRSAITDEGKSITRDMFERKLAENGLYAPVLWPIYDEARAVCKVASDFSDNMLAFWIDQRYSRFDMENVAEIFADTLSKI